jgi:hypothetical protein
MRCRLMRSLDTLFPFRYRCLRSRPRVFLTRLIRGIDMAIEPPCLWDLITRLTIDCRSILAFH